ncbi:MAG: TolC family protein [Planctomycetes bacterium]|nr:TolC family protein [Planctomycetota bacterium]
MSDPWRPRRAAWAHVVAVLLPLLCAAAPGCTDARPRNPDLYRQALAEDLGAVGPRADAGGATSPATPALGAPALPAGPLDLTACVRLALRQNERLALAGESWLQTVLRRDQAIALVLPAVTAKGSYFRQDEFHAAGSSGGGESGGSSSSVEPDRREAVLQIKQPIFHGFKDFAASGQAGRLAEAAREGLREEERAVALLAAEGFYRVLSAQAQAETLVASVTLGEERLREVTARHQQGLARRTDVLAVDTQLARDRALLTQARNLADGARVRLGVILGGDTPAALADDTLERTPPAAVGELIAVALERRPDLRRLAAEIAAAEQAVSVEQGDLWPAADVTANWYAHREGFSTTQQATDWDVTLNLEYPLFEGGITRARIREAESAQRQARLRHAAAARAVAGEVRAARLDLESSDALCGQFEANLRLADENHRLAQEEYRQGLGSNLEVLVAQNQLQAARLDLERQKYQRRLDAVALDAAIGLWPVRSR